jgi:hypothetical protein
MGNTVDFAKNAQGEWEGDFGSHDGLRAKVFLIEEDSDRPSFSHGQIYLIKAGAGDWAGSVKKGQFFGWVGETGMRLLIEEMRADIRSAESGISSGDQRALLERIAEVDWVLIDSEGNEAHVFRAPKDDDDGWV